jgi:O-antigen/teichoic acid export membrane protein
MALAPSIVEAGPDASLSAGKRSSLILLNATLRAIADIGSKLATAFLYLLVARRAGASEFGIFAFGLSFAGIAVTLGQFGQDLVLTREVARDRRRLSVYYSDALVSRIVLSVPPLLIVVAISYLAGMKEQTLLVVLLLGLGFVGDYTVQVSFAVFQAYERIGLVTVILIAQRWLTTAVAVTALYLGGSIVAVSAIYCTGAVLAAGLAAALVFRKVARPTLRFDLRGAMRITREAAPVGLGVVAFLLLARIDTTMLALFTSSSEVGQYGAAYRLLETTAFVTWSVNTAVLPTMARLTPLSVPTVGAVYQRAVKLVLAITVPLAVGAAILAAPIVALLYGSQYHRAGPAVVLLAPTIMLFPVSSLSSQLLYAQNVRRVVSLTYAAVFLENVVWNLIAIPRFTLYGAAAGTSVSELIVAGTLLYFSRHLHGRLDLRRILAGPALGSAVAAGVMALFSRHLALAVPLGAIAYLLVFLAHERLAFPDDFDVIVKFVGRLRRLTDPQSPTSVHG